MEIWTKTADLAVSVAGRVLARELNRDDHRRLVEAALGELPASPGGQRGGEPQRMSTDQDASAASPGRSSRTTRPRWRGPTPRPWSTPPTKGDEVEAVLDELDAILRRRLRREPAVRRAAGLAVGPPPTDKDRILAEAFEGRALPTVVRFLRVLNRHGRLGLLAPIARAGPGDLGPPPEPPAGDGPLGRPARRRRSRTPSATGSPACSAATPVLHLEVDPALIGGLVVQVGDDVYDASIRTACQLRDRLVEGRTGRSRAVATSSA